MTLSRKRLHALAVSLIGLAIAMAALSLFASSKAASHYGPQALAIVGEDVWIADESGLLVIDDSGATKASRTLEMLGMDDISSIVPAPGKKVLLGSRASTTLRLLDQRSLQVLRTLSLTLPPDLDDSAYPALWFATRPTDEPDRFEIAMATGGNHAVLRFSDDGKLLARTRPGLYRFTNGIWYGKDGLWTTDTNRFFLRRLDSDSLQQVEAVPLSARNSKRYLGAAIASQGTTNEHDKLPLATLVRLKTGMLVGRVVDVFPDGSEIEYPLPDQAEPADIAWYRNELLVVDGASHTLQRFDRQHKPLGAFGNADLNRRFEASSSMRILSKRVHDICVTTAIVSLVCGLLLIALRQRASHDEKTLQPGLPLPDRRRMQLFMWRLFWPVLIPLAALLMLNVPTVRYWINDMANAWIQSEHVWAMLIVFLLSVLMSIVAWARWVRRRAMRLTQAPDAASLMNYAALRWLHRSASWRGVMQPGERPCDVIRVTLPRAGYLLVTDRRVLMFASGTGNPVGVEFMRGDINHVSLETLHAKGWKNWRQNLYGIRLDIQLAGERNASFHLAPPAVAQHIADSLRQHPQPVGAATPGRYASEAGSGGIGKQVVASLLVPGSGMWMQRRNLSALIYFISAACLMTFTIAPVAWALMTGHSDVSERSIRHAIIMWAYVAILCALDTWWGRPRDPWRVGKLADKPGSVA